MVSLADFIRHLRRRQYQFAELFLRDNETLVNSFYVAIIIPRLDKQENYRSTSLEHRYKSQQDINTPNLNIYIFLHKQFLD